MRHRDDRPWARCAPLLLLLGALLPGGGGRARADEPAPPALPSPPALPAPPARPPTPSGLVAEMDAVREGPSGPLGEHDFMLVLRLSNPGASDVEVRAGNLLLRSEGGWLSPLDPPALVGSFAHGVAIAAGGTQRVEPPLYKVLGPARDVVLALEASDGLLLMATALRVAAMPAPDAVAPPAWPVSLGIHGPLEAVPYADGHRSIVVVGQVQCLGAGTLTEVQGSLVVGGDAGTTSPVVWTGGVEEGEGPALWPFLQRVDVGNDFAESTVSLRWKGLLDGVPVRAELDLPARAVEPFLCSGPVLGAWQLANGPAERQLNANMLQLRSRYAWDFVVTKDGRTHDGDVTSNTSYYAFDRSIRAVADGEVVDRCDHQLDRSGQEASAAPCVYTPVNRIVLKHADGTHTAYLHLRQGSIPKGIGTGSSVRAGQVIGRVGNSGASSEPHLQLSAFRTDEQGTIRPVPMAFRNAFEDAKGARKVEGVPVGGTQVHFLERH